MGASIGDVRVLAFDTFGTLTDWHSGVASVAAQVVPDVDAELLAREWRTRYAPILARVESGDLPWENFDPLHRRTLADTADALGITVDDAAASHLVGVWRRLPAWPDVVDGLTRLKTRFTITPLSNGNVALLSDMAKHNGFPWDFIGGADLWRHYKPSSALYLGIAELFEVPPEQVMMVATHQNDLDAARANGLRTAFIERLLEWGGAPKDDSGSPRNDLHARDVGHLADQLLSAAR